MHTYKICKKMSATVKQWLQQKFPSDKENKLTNFVQELYSQAQTVAEIERFVSDADAKLKAHYLIALSAKTLKNTNLRSKLLGLSLDQLSINDFEAKSDRIQKISEQNSITTWPNHPNLYVDQKNVFQQSSKLGAERLGVSEPKSILGKLGVTYGLDPKNIEQSVYRFALLQQPLVLQKSKNNRQAINELLYLTNGGKNLPDNIRKILVEEFKNVQGKFENDKPVIIDTKDMMKQEASQQKFTNVEIDVSEEELKDDKSMEETLNEASDLKEKEQADLQKQLAQFLSQKAIEIRQKFPSVQGETKAALERISVRFEQLAKLSKDCADVISNKSLLSLEKFDLCNQQYIQITAESKLLEESEFFVLQLAEREKELQEKQMQLQNCKLERENLKKNTSQKQSELEQQIREMEKMRLQTESAVENLKNERSDIQKKLSSLLVKLEKILAVKKNCAAIGKTIEEALGAKEAEKFNSIQSKVINEKQNLQEILATITNKVNDLSLIVNGAQQTECSLQEQLNKLQIENDENRTREMKLDAMVLQERETVSELQKKVRSLEEASKKTVQSSNVVEKLQKDLEKCSTEKKIGSNKFTELEVLAKDLLQETKTVTEKAQKCEVATKEHQEKCIEKQKQIQEQAQQEQKNLRQALELCETRSASLIKYQKIIEDQQAQLQKVRNEKIRLEKNLEKCSKILTSKSVNLATLEEEKLSQQNLLEKTQEENQASHKIFLERIIQDIVKLDLDLDEKKFSNQINKFDKEDQEYILSGLQEFRKGQKPLSGIASASIRKDIVETKVKELEKKVYEMKLAEADTVAKYELLKNQLDAAQKSLENCKSQSNNTSSDDALKLAQSERDEIQQKLEASKLTLETMQKEVQDLQSLKIFADEQFEKCKADKEELVTNYEKTDNEIGQKIAAMKQENLNLTQKLEELSNLNPQALQNQVVELRNEIDTLKQKEKELEEEATSLYNDSNKSKQEKDALTEDLKEKNSILQKTKALLENCENSVEKANKEIVQVNQLKEKLQQCQKQSSNQMQNSIQILENQISNLIAERNTLREQNESFQQALVTAEREKGQLQDLLNREKTENATLSKNFKAAVDLLEKLKVSDANNQE